MKNSTLAAATLAAFSLLPEVAAAEPPGGPWKCRGEGPVPHYQDSPCPPGRELRNLAESPAAVSVIPFDAPRPGVPPPKVRSAKPPAAKKEKPRHAGDAAERRHAREGMSEGEVLARLGTPDLQSGKGRAMRWTYLPATGDPQTVTVLRFDDGRVTHVERKVLR